MNSLLKKLFLLFCLLFAPILNAQYLINNYDGIPIIASVPWDVLDNHLDSAKAMGADFIIATQLTETRLTDIKNRGLKVIPLQTKFPQEEPYIPYNYIMRYSEGAYTKWEAEGTPVGKGDAKLKYKTNICSTFTSGSIQGVVTNIGAGYDTLIYGPGYMQERRYWRIDTGYVNYKAEFNLMLSNIIPEGGNPNDTICILQVTDSKIVGPPSEPYRDSTIFVKDTVLLRGDFSIGIWDTITLNYNFRNEESDVQQPSNQLPNHTYQNYQSNEPTNKNLADFVQFKIIWKGDPHSRLFVDNIIISDQKGKDIITIPAVKQNIVTQATQSFPNTNIDNYVAAWFTIDEPETIDNYEPMRVIDSLLKASSNGKRGLWVSFPSSWNGKYGDSDLGAQGLYKSNEFIQRTGITPHQNNHPLFDAPYRPDEYPYYQDYKVRNIRVLADDIMNRVNDWDSTFSMTLLCGKVEQARLFHDPLPHEMLYEANLKLLYGAKSLSLYRYFGGDNNPGFTGLVNYTDSSGYTYTDKYYMLRNILAPRLKGLFGKTLKSLKQAEQLIEINARVGQLINKDFISKIQSSGGSADTCFVDIGFFKDLNYLDKQYFMLINRYYSNKEHLTIYFKDLSNYKNWEITDFVESSRNTVLATQEGTANITTTISKGDARLYSVLPVVKYGGKLILSETVTDGTALYNDMSIESGATLNVNGTYNAKANITVKSGGKIVASTNGKIIFDANKKLIVEGTTEIKGYSPINKLTLEFVNSEKGIDVWPGSSLTLSYCNITGAYYGLVTRTGTPSYLNIIYSNFAFGSTGIVLNGNFYGEGSSSSRTSTISGCTFTTWGTGISVSNNSAVIISQNSFTSCGISILNVPTAYIQSNSIYSGSNQSYSGIFFNSSGGYIRNNLVKNRVNGIHLANSSPDIGGNVLEGNYLHGLYIGTGSIPNLVGLVQTNPPTYFALAGYNTIFNNGNNTQVNTEDDGSEIYFSYSDAYLGTEKFPGCNEISDDRTSTPSMSTVLLLGGYYYNEPHFLDAIYNYWGTTTPYNDRFAIATNYSPYSDEPCSPNGGGEEEILLAAPSGEIIDTIKSAEGIPLELTALEASFSGADNLFAAGNIMQAKPLYEQIVSSNYTAEEKLPAYNKLYAIGNLIGEDENYFSSLQTTFNDIASAETNILLKKIYNQNAIKCDVSKEEYLTAISKFDNIIQQNPNSEEAVYAEIDIITIALNLDTTNSQLGKMGNGKYLVKGTSDYLSRLNDILKSKFGINSEEKEEIIPKEYSLYQNFPNPFNPVTTIKFDIPNDGLITLEIFDILGRRIITLLEEYKPAGSYEQVFDASSLASGVYVYKLQAGDYVSSRKMILLK